MAPPIQLQRLPRRKKKPALKRALMFLALLIAAVLAATQL